VIIFTQKVRDQRAGGQFRNYKPIKGKGVAFQGRVNVTPGKKQQYGGRDVSRKYQSTKRKAGQVSIQEEEEERQDGENP
jgi:hypothetical protein